MNRDKLFVRQTISPRFNYDAVVVDMNHLAFRIGMVTDLSFDGINTGMIHTGVRVLYNLVTDIKPKKMLLCWDGPNNWRKKIVPEYKANRKPLDNELVLGMSRFRVVCRLLGFSQVSSNGYEADDWMAWAAATTDTSLLIVTGDKDLYQLINDERTHHVLKPSLGEAGYKVITEEIAESEFCKPDEVVTYKLLVGDSSDNIKGVKGVGPKTARTLIDAWGRCDEWLLQDKRIYSGPEKWLKLVFQQDTLDYLKELYRIIDLSKDHSPDDKDLFEQSDFMQYVNGITGVGDISALRTEMVSMGLFQLLDDSAILNLLIKECPKLRWDYR